MRGREKECGRERTRVKGERVALVRTKGVKKKESGPLAHQDEQLKKANGVSPHCHGRSPPTRACACVFLPCKRVPIGLGTRLASGLCVLAEEAVLPDPGPDPGAMAPCSAPVVIRASTPGICSGVCAGACAGAGAEDEVEAGRGEGGCMSAWSEIALS